MQQFRLEMIRIIRRPWFLVIVIGMVFLEIWVGEIQSRQNYEKYGCSREDYIADLELYDGQDLETMNQSLGGEFVFGKWLIQKEAAALSGYDDYLTGIQSGGGGLSGISFFAQDSYTAAVSKKAEKDYRGLAVSIENWVSNGAAAEFLQSRVADMAILLVILIVALLLFTEEREQDYILLTRTMHRGRGSLYRCKMAVLLVFCLFAVFLYEGAMLGYECYVYKMIHWDAPIQSIAATMSCNWQITVRDAVILFFLVKAFSMCAVASIVAALSCAGRKFIQVIAAAAGMIVILMICFQRGNVNNKAGWLNYLNPIRLLDTTETVVNYHNIRLFDRPVSGLLMSVILLLFYFAAGFILGQIFYGRPSFRLMKKDRVRKKTAARGSGTLVGWEMKKLLGSYKIGLILSVITIGIIGGFYRLEDMPLSVTEQYYRQYMVELNGPLTEEKERYLTEEGQRFEDLENMRMELILQGAPTIVINRIDGLLIQKTAYEMVVMQYDRIKEGAQEVFLYDTGYLYLFGAENYYYEGVGILAGLLLAAILIPFLIHIELQHHAAAIIRTMYLGRKRVLCVQYFAYFIMTVWIFFVITAGVWGKLFSQFGTYGLTEKIGNIAVMDGIYAELPIWSYLLLILLLRVFGIAVLTFTGMAIAYAGKEYLNNVVILLIGMVLPYVLWFNGFKITENYFVPAVVNGNTFLQFLQCGMWWKGLLSIVQIVLVMGAAGYFMRKETNRLWSR